VGGAWIGVDVAPRGAASFGVVEAVARLGVKDMVLPGTLFLRHPGRWGGGGEVTEDSVIFCVRFASRSFMHRHINMVQD
jgi:hypothetical protein